MPLTDPSVKRLIERREVGDHRDGDGLFLRLSRTGKASWFLGYRFDGKKRTLKLGTYDELSCYQARDAVAEVRDMLEQGVDPKIGVQSASGAGASSNAISPSTTLGDALEVFVAEVQTGLKNPKHAKGYRSQIAPFIEGEVGQRPVGRVNHHDIQPVLEQMWRKTPCTAQRVGQALAKFFRWARGKDAVADPALSIVAVVVEQLKSIEVDRTVKHHPSLPYADLPGFYAKLAKRDAMAAITLRWIILTGCRSIEGRGARWDELDLGSGLITNK